MFLTNPYLYRKTLRLSVEDRAYAIDPKPVGLRRAIRLRAQPASMAVSGKTVGLRRAARIAVPVRTYTITPVASRVLRNRKIIAGVRSLATTPRSVVLFKSRVAGFVLTTYAITGQSVTLKRNLRLRAQPASMALSLKSVGISKTIGSIDPLPAAFTITAQSMMMRAARKMTVTNAGYVLAGQQQKLLRTYPLQANPAAWTISGQSAILKRKNRIVAVKADWVFAQPSVTLTYTENGIDLNYIGTYNTQADSTSYSISSQPLGSGDRWLIIGVGHAASVDTTSLTVAGISATQIYDPGSTSLLLPTWWKVYLSSAVGSTGTIAMTRSSGDSNGFYWGLWTVGSNWSETVSATANNGGSSQTNPSITMTIPNKGWALAMARNPNNTSFSWTNATLRFNANLGNNLVGSGADYQNTGSSASHTITAVAGNSRLSGLVIV